MSISTLDQAIEAHRAGRVSQAYQLYITHLQSSPNDLQALELVGVLLFNNGNFKEAIQFFALIEQLSPKDDKNLNHLCHCYWRLGDLTQAIRYADLLIRYFGNKKELIELKCSLLQQNQGYQAVLEWLESHLATNPKDYEVLLLLGNIANNNNDYQKAIAVFQKAITIKPNAIVPKHNLGLAYRLSGKAETALEYYHQVEQAGNDSYQLMHNIGNAYSDLGRLDNAVIYYEKALSKNLGYLETHKNLNALYWELNDQHHFLTSYERAMVAFPQEFSFVAAFCHSLIRVGRYQEAIAKLESVKQTYSDNIVWQSIYLICLVTEKRHDEARELLLSINYNIDVNIDSANVLAEIAEQAIELQAYNIAQQLAEKVVKVLPQHQFSLSLLSLCYRELQDTRYMQLVSYDDRVKEIQLIDIRSEQDKAFLQNLIAALIPMHTAVQQPIDQTLRGGTQTKGNLFQSENPYVIELRQRIETAINRYIRELPIARDAHFPTPTENQFEFAGAWSVRLHEEGFHSNHIHPDGWLSSVIYLELPSDIDNEQAHSGWLKFGEPNLSQHHKFMPERLVKPEVGKLVLFPSYYWHGTVPFHSDSTRMTVAFDVAIKQ